MAAKPKNIASLSRDQLEEDILKYKREGGEIQQVPSGVSGVTPTKGPRHIVINPSKR